MGKTMRTIWLRPKWAKNKLERIGKNELERKKEKDIHAKSIIIPILINSTHFHWVGDRLVK